ncbi:MAG TPA: alpha/beta fold hydrolase, partial [Gemmatimonadota bacterium]|nr:alpha/beta fold hydrolase [Gemmatimonadota bacterium]
MRHAVLLLLLSCLTPPCSQGQPALAFTGVTVIPMDTERVLDGHTVLVEGERIVAVGPAGEVEIPDGATVVDGSGRWLIPGLAEMHGHIPPPSVPRERVENVLFLYVANGITTVRGVLGAPGQLELKAEANSGALVSPTLYLAGPSFNGNSVSSPGQAAAMVREQAEAGWDLLKIHPGLTRAEYDSMAVTARAAGIRFVGHVPEEVGLAHALEMGQETIEHLDGYVEYLDGAEGPVDPVRLAEAVERTRASGAAVVPTMALWETLYGIHPLETLTAYPELRYMPGDMVQAWTENYRERLADSELDPVESRIVIENRTRILSALHDGGVTVLMGTDSPQLFSVPGFSLHREVTRMAAAGMSPWEILASGTRAVGEYFAGEDDFGTIAPGQRADLVLLSADPLQDVASLSGIEGVMVRGRWHPKTAIDERLAAIAAASRQGTAARAQDVEGYATAEDGTRLFYTTVGDGPEDVVIPVGLYLEEALRPLAKPGRRLVFYDPRGRGRSESPDTLRISLDHQVTDLEALRTHLGIERMALIGWSGLGMEMVVYAMRHPDRVSRIVQVAPVPPRNSPHNESAYAERERRIDQAALERLEERSAAGEFSEDPGGYCRARSAVTRVASFADPARAAEVPDVCRYPNEWSENLGPLFRALL